MPITNPHTLKLWHRLKKFANSWIGFACILLVVYHGIRFGQGYLGRQTFDATGLPQHSLQQAQQIAAEKQQLIVAELSAYWCSTCKAVDKELLSQPEIKTLLTQRYVYARIDETSPEAEVFTQRYGAQGYPTLVLLDSSGQLLKILPLTLDVATFMQSLTQ